ncbi:HEPN/Toprim-associated domain-containing protein [Paraburkholderia tropica]|uniref:HEPN/Toprim-associated domain-containing protein n=1 Tax=Paraburkholderia tropica TaxID=92647 RepID=UPI002ABD7D2E|nr:HEPN/Toprim-associated domain-containing protein [Paraburkholderia tropica]
MKIDTNIMQIFANLKIDGLLVQSTYAHYEPWHFSKEDRVIRASSLSDMSIQQRVEDYLYVAPVRVLRQRLESAGYNRTTLALDHLKYMQSIFQFRQRPSVWSADRTEAPSQASAALPDAFRLATLDDWLIALQEYKKGSFGWRRPRTTRIDAPGCSVDANMLLNIMLRERSPAASPSSLDGTLYFPCTSFENMVVAALELASDDAECVLDLTDFIEHGQTSDFDDLIAERKRQHALARAPHFDDADI